MVINTRLATEENAGVEIHLGLVVGFIISLSLLLHIIVSYAESLVEVAVTWETKLQQAVGTS